MKFKFRLYGSIGMGLAIALGAFGSHWAKGVLNETALSAYDIGVRYLFYHSLASLALATWFDNEGKEGKRIFLSFFWGTLLFSGSLILLSFQVLLPFSLKGIGIITPPGGILLLVGWTLTVRFVLKSRKMFS
ncbi:MAG: DUF423 domain-containing protein [Flavobacteriaceae bacterium]|jgi:uncharacterized membrane protein YgdD (TMEM256/DUF423 family)